MRWMRVVASLVVVLVSVLVAPFAWSDAAGDAFDQGAAKDERGDLDGAIADYTRAIALNPRFARAYYNRGAVRQRRGDLETANSDYTSAIQLSPRFTWAYYNRGTAKAALRDYNGAYADYDLSVRVDPRFPEGYAARGALRADRGDLAGGLSDEDRAIALRPRFARAYSHRGDIRRAQGDDAGGVADYDQAIALDPRSMDAWFSRGLWKREQGDVPGALSDLDHAVAAEPSSERAAEVYFTRGLLRRATSDLAGAGSDFSQAIQRDPRVATYYFNRADVQDRLGASTGVSLGDLDKGLALDPKNVKAIFMRSRVRERAGDDEGALEDVHRAVALEPDSSVGRFELGRMQLCRRAFADSVVSYRRVLSIDADRSYARFFLFLAQAMGPDGEEAARNALRENPVHPPETGTDAVWILTIQRFLVDGMTPKDFVLASQSVPEDARQGNLCEALFYIGAISWLHGDHEKAATLFQRCISTKMIDFDEYLTARAALKWPR